MPAPEEAAGRAEPADDVPPRAEGSPTRESVPPALLSPSVTPVKELPRDSVRVGRTGRRRPWLIAATRPFGRLLFRTAFRVQVLGTEHVPTSGPVLMAGNHTGFLDGPLVYAFGPRPATFLAKAELFAGPLAHPLGWLGQVPVHRGRPDRRALQAAVRVLTAGGALGVFPEGTRGSGAFEQVADGVGWLALRSGAPVVPLAVIGTAQALPKGGRPRWRAPIAVVFGPPVRLAVEGDPRARRTVGAATEQLRLALVAHLQTATEHAAAPQAERDR